MAADKMNRKQRKELARQLQSANPGLEIVHPRAAGIDEGNSAITWQCVRTKTRTRCAGWNASRRTCIV